MRDRLASSADYFSINLLLTTLFSPFRQISVDSTTVTPGDHMKAFFDKSIVGRFNEVALQSIG